MEKISVDYKNTLQQALITCENTTCCKDCVYWSVCNDYDTNPINVESFINELKKIRLNVE